MPLSQPVPPLGLVDFSRHTFRRGALIALGGVYFIIGFITCLNDSLVPFFRQGFNLGYAQSSLVQFYFFLTYGVVSVPMGRVIDHLGYKKAILIGFLIMAFGTLLFFPAAGLHQYAFFLAALFLIAIGVVLLQVAANPFINMLGTPQTASSRFTLIQSIGSVGTTLAPLFGSYFILSHIATRQSSMDSLKWIYLGLSFTLLMAAWIVHIIPFPSVPAAPKKLIEPRHSFSFLFSFRRLNFGVLALFVYVGAEVGIGTFLTNYIADSVHLSGKEASNWLSIYWGGMLVGRLIGSQVLNYFMPAKVLSLSALLAISCVLSSLLASGYWAIGFMLAVGLFNSIQFATIFSLSLAEAGPYRNMASGLLASAIVGGAIIPVLQGYLKDHYSWTISFLVPAMAYLVILVFALRSIKYSQNSLPLALSEV